MKLFVAGLLILGAAWCASAQETTGSLTEKRVPLSEAAVALDGTGVPALEVTLRTTALNGAPETPVTNVRMLIKNRSNVAYAFVAGAVTFYDAAGVRCGEGVFKADAIEWARTQKFIGQRAVRLTALPIRDIHFAPAGINAMKAPGLVSPRPG